MSGKQIRAGIGIEQVTATQLQMEAMRVAAHFSVQPAELVGWYPCAQGNPVKVKMDEDFAAHVFQKA